MVEYFRRLTHNRLFEGVKPRDLLRLLQDIGATVASYKKGDIAVPEGEKNDCVGLVLSGEMQGVKYSYQGKKHLVSRFLQGDIFGELLSGSDRESPVAIECFCRGEVLLLPFSRLMGAQRENRSAALTVLKNIMGALSEKYFSQLKRIRALCASPIKKRIAVYLVTELSEIEQNGDIDRNQEYSLKNSSKTAKNAHIYQKNGDSGRRRVKSNMTRTALAAYLGCDRSALSRGIGELVRGGVIACDKRDFVIADKSALYDIAES